MANDIPELGSKISLISNADIRYEGKLYSVDPQECTIALSNVRSFGTEDRKSTNQVPAQAQIYDFILFRATDIKDISVVPSTHLLYDPAIVQLSGPSATAGRPFSGMGASGSLDNSAGGPGSGDFGGLTGRSVGPIGAPPSSSSMNHHFGVLGNASGSGSAAPGGSAGPIGGGGGGAGNFSAMKSGLLHSLTRPSPSELLHHQTPSSMKQHDMLAMPRSNTPNTNNKQASVDQLNARTNSRKSFGIVDTPSEDGMANRSHQDKSRKPRNDQQGFNNQNNRPRYNQNQQQMRNHVGSGRPLQNHQQPNTNSNWNQHRGGIGQQQNSSGGGVQQQGRMRNPRNNSGGVGGGGGGQRSNYNNARPGGGGGGMNRPKPQPLKFESDYDFDKANTEFEELRSELNKMKIDAPTAAPVTNGDEWSKTDEWGGIGATTANNEGGATGGEDANAGSDPQYFYNKNKSFFDNISCEAVERSKGIQKTDWRKERKLNTETFGVASSRRNNYYRNNQRGPGGYGYGYSSGGFRQYQQFFKRHIQQPPQRQSQPQIRPRPIPYELLPMRPRSSISPFPLPWLAPMRIF